MSGVELELRLRLPLSAFSLEIDLVENVRSVGVFGRSGAGKSSLLEALAGLRPQATGRIRFGSEVWLDSERSVRVPPEQRGIGFVPQAALLFPHLDVRQNLRFGAARARERRDAVTVERVAEMLDITGLLDREPRALSGGEQKRVALGRALCSGPRLLLLDEPFAGLDLSLRQRLRGMLLRVVEELALPMLLVSHDPADIQALCASALALESGKLIAQGEPSRVLSDPRVLPLTDGFENVFEVRILAHEGPVSRVSAGKPGSPELLVPRCSAPIGERALVGLRARDVLVATRRPEGLSARNVVAVVVEELAASETGVHVRLRLGTGTGPDTAIVAELTSGAQSELELSPGRQVFMVVKAQAFSVVA
jgi:molybdate transport system ATP-binding protein